jgi:hypothetical protein
MSDFLQSAGACATGTSEARRASLLDAQKIVALRRDLHSAHCYLVLLSKVRILEPQRQNGMSDFSQSAGARTTGTSEARRASLLDAKKIVSL